MTQILRQGATVDFMMGPFLDLTAGTAEEALAIVATEVWVSINGATYVNKNESTNPANQSKGGMYLVKIDSVDTANVGTLDILVDDTADAAIPVVTHFQVVETAVYDALYANNATAFNSSGQVALLTATQASIDGIETDTGTTLDTKINTIDTLLDTITAALITAAGEPAQGTPAESLSTADKIAWLYKFQINKKLQTATQFSLRDTGDTQVDTKSTISDDGTTLTYGAMATGP